MLQRLIRNAESRHVFKLHATAVALFGLYAGALTPMPVILRRHLGADEWQTTVVTMAIPAFAILTLVWNQVYVRVKPRTFLIGLWLTNYAPVAGISFCDEAWTTLLFYVASTLTFGAAFLFNADILRHCYPGEIRNRLYSVIHALGLCFTILAAYVVGVALDYHPDAYQVYLPIAALLAGVGVMLLIQVSRQPTFRDRDVETPKQSFGTSVVRIFHDMLDVFRSDARFRRCEIAFFVYGMGYMSAYAIVPLLVWDKLMLDYTAIARSTQVAYNTVLLFTLVVGGWLMDRFGPMRVTRWSLTMVILYPIGLMLAQGELSLTAVVIYNALAMTGVQLGGMMLPVTLARRSHQAATYVGIHTGLVGPRAIIAPIIAVRLYTWTGDFMAPLAMSALCYAGGALLMYRLERRIGTTAEASADVPVGTAESSPGKTVV